MLKTQLPKTILSIDEAKEFLTKLHLNGEGYHPEDDANDCLSHIASKEEGDKLNDLMSQIYDLKNFDPCEFLVDSHLSDLVEMKIAEGMVKGYLLDQRNMVWYKVKLIEPILGKKLGDTIKILQSQIIVPVS